MFVYSASFSPSPLDNALTPCPAAPGLQPQWAKFIPAGALFTSLVLFTAWSILPRTRQWPSPQWTVHVSPSLTSAVPRLPVWSLGRCLMPCALHVFAHRTACGPLSVWEALGRCGLAWAVACPVWLSGGPRWLQPPSVLAGGTPSPRKMFAASSAVRVQRITGEASRPGIAVLYHESVNGAAHLTQPRVGALLPTPPSAVGGHRPRLSCTYPCPPDGLVWVGRTELAGAQPPLPAGGRTGCHTRGLDG